MLFAVNGDQENSSSHSKNKEMKQQQEQEGTAAKSPVAAPLFQLPVRSSVNPPLFETAKAPAPLFTIPDTPTTTATLKSVASSSPSPSTSTTATASVTSSSASNSQSSFATLNQPLHAGLNFSRSSNNNMNLNIYDNVRGRRTSSHFATFASTPDLSTETGIPFPTLHQVKQQSVRRSTSCVSGTTPTAPVGSGTGCLTDQQKATLERVTRLAARTTNVPVAVISTFGDLLWTSSSAGEETARILAHHGLMDGSWRTLATQVLTQDPRGGEPHPSSSSDLAYFEHIPLLSRTGGHRIGSLTLMARTCRLPLTAEERLDLEDLTFLAAQALGDGMVSTSRSIGMTTAPPLQLRRQVSNSSSSAESLTAAGTSRSTSRSSRGPGQPRGPASFKSDTTTTMPMSMAMMPLETIDGSQQSQQTAAATPTHLPPPLPQQQQQQQQPQDVCCDESVHSHTHQSLESATTPEEDPSRCLIACTAHDLLTPLMGLQLSLSLLQEDAKFVRHLEEQPLQRESFWTAWQSTEVMFRMCQTTIDTLRANKAQESQGPPLLATSTPPPETEICNLDITVLLHSLQRLMDPIPKQVPLVMTLQGKVPNQVPIVTTTTSTTAMTPTMGGASAASTVDWHILRCALTVLSHACRHSKKQSIQLNIGIVNQRLVVECKHDCIEQQVDDTAAAAAPVEDDLALKSVAHQMQSVHGGLHGFTPCQQPQQGPMAGQAPRAVFWFSVPVGPHRELSSSSLDRVITLLPQQLHSGPIPPPPPAPSQQQQQQQQQDGSSTLEDMPTLTPMLMDNSEPAKSVRRENHPWRPVLRNPKSLSPNFQNRGLRKLRRSSTGSTNTLGGRRRTFHDMDGLRDEAEYMPPTLSTAHLPQLLPSMIKAQSTIVAPTATSLAGAYRRNYQYPSRKKIQKTTAHSAVAAAFQAGLDVANDVGQDSRLSYSLLKEQEQLDTKERLQPWMMSASERSHGSRTGTGSTNGLAAGGAAGTGLDRCFKDLMGSSAMAVDNVRERLYNRGTSGASNVGSTLPKPAMATSSTQRERKALVIEDSLVIRKTVARALTKLGIQTVVQANDGLEGVARMQEDVFDITLCDFSMPNLGGIDCVKQYRQWEKQQSLTRPKQYIIGMSAHASPNDIAQGLQVGMNEYHPKPLTIKKLTELLDSSPLQQARCELDREWQRKQGQSSGMTTPTTNTSKPSMFADFTKPTVGMLDTISTSGRSQVPFVAENGVQSKGPKTKALFSIVTS